MEASEQNSSFQHAENASTSVIQANIVEDARGNNYFSRKDYSQTTFAPNSDINEKMHMAEFQTWQDENTRHLGSIDSNQPLAQFLFPLHISIQIAQDV